MENSTVIKEPAQLSNTLAPITSNKRIEVMDLLRGFALIGILFMNIEWFNRPVSILLSFDYSQTGFDWGTSWLVKVFVEGKFYKLFSLLFGMGFAVMLIRAQQAERKFGAWFTRRMLTLFCFGMAHMVFLWGGDILHDYAAAGMLLLGFVLLLQTKRFSKFNKPETFLKVGLSLMLFPLVVMMCIALFFGATRDNTVMTDDWQQTITVHQQTDLLLLEAKKNPAISKDINADSNEELRAADHNRTETSDAIDNEALVDEAEIESSPEEIIAEKVEERFKHKQDKNEESHAEIIAFTQPSYIEATKFRASAAIESLIVTPVFAFFVCLPLFMIGYWLVASERLKRPEQHQGFFNMLCWGGLLIGLMINIACVFIALHPATKTAFEIRQVNQNLFYYGQLILCVGYIGMFVKLTTKTWFMKMFAWLAPLGKMALTNYISHSIILTSIFYGYAGGMFGEIPRGEQALIVVSIIFVQAFISHLWLKAFRFGPLEWLWRSMTYMKVQPMLLDKLTDSKVSV
jgi:uncharacterized membrane protein YeiB